MSDVETALAIATRVLVLGVIGAVPTVAFAAAESKVGRWRRRQADRVRTLRRRLTLRLARHTLTRADEVISPVLPDNGLHARPLIEQSITRWWHEAVIGLPVGLIFVAFFGYLASYAVEVSEDIRRPLPPNANPQEGGEAYSGLDPFASLYAGTRDAVLFIVDQAKDLVHRLQMLWGQPWEKPWDTATTLVFLMFVYIVIDMARRIFPAILAAFGVAHRKKESTGGLPPSLRSGLGVVFAPAVDKHDERRHRPVAVILSYATGVARAHQEMGERSPLDVRRVSVRGVERVIRRAWKVRHGTPKPPHRRELKTHAAKVVGALRRAEERQYTDEDPGMALKDLTEMLLTIAERYAEGRTGQLLDDVDEIEPVTDRTALRMAGAIAVFLLILFGTPKLGLPDSAAGSLQGVAAIAAVAVFFNHRYNATDLVDIFRGA
ncbi:MULTISPECIES: hypothetical protein [Streptomyces]|uniref:Type II secretion system protein GspF domain-containing protein n=1 Tax=Streptomyces evansiae TaxID=3075535 RepID=A0ABU2QZM0_9ACTN|nr:MULTISPECIES: hypothetical protein [unclassified Streptomyces]MDT0409411.1 hypothetical protein [Streptomyces sp. DSM 41979]MYQ59751.1 hypothetical protein [Streptomyces sp. SID4926]SCE38291.1 hypothetical protein GA0115252_144410 [Streptomyces sp. DfronAA-171]